MMFLGARHRFCMRDVLAEAFTGKDLMQKSPSDKQKVVFELWKISVKNVEDADALKGSDKSQDPWSFC